MQKPYVPDAEGPFSWNIIMIFKKYAQHQSFRFPVKCPQPPFWKGEMTPPIYVCRWYVCVCKKDAF